MVKVRKANNADGFCCSCLDNKPHRRLYYVEVKTYGSTMRMHLCEHCAKELRDGINSPSERIAPPAPLKQGKKETFVEKLSKAKVKANSYIEADEKEWAEEGEEEWQT